MARFFADAGDGPRRDRGLIEGEAVPWSRHIIWGNYRVTGGVPLPGSNAWTLGLTWGAMKAGRGNARRLGRAHRRQGADVHGRDDNIVWATTRQHRLGHRRAATTSCGQRAAATTSCGPPAAAQTSSGPPVAASNIVWATGGRDNIVWATRRPRQHRLGDRGPENIVWATAMAENLVWGNDCGGHDCTGGDRAGGFGTRRATATSSGHRDAQHRLGDGMPQHRWATAGSRNIVWATGGARNIVWATGAEATESSGLPKHRRDRVAWRQSRLSQAFTPRTRNRSDNESTRHDYLAASRRTVGLVR